MKHNPVMLDRVAKTRLQTGLLVITLIISYLLQIPQPHFDFGHYTSLASEYVNAPDKGNDGGDAASILKGVNIVVTGATSGLGLDLAKTLHKLGGTIIAVGRSESKLANLANLLDSKNNTKRVVTIVADLQDLDSVSAAGDKIRSKYKSIDYLINNAGLTNGPYTKVPTPQGFDMIFGVNYLSHFLLTEKLLPSLKRSKLASGSRIVQISSSAHVIVNGDDLVPSSSSLAPLASEETHTILHAMNAYANSKLAQIYHTRSLNREFENNNSPIKVVSVCPTWVATHIAGASAKLFLDVFGFRPDGWGQAPILHAMFHKDVGAKVNKEGGIVSYNDYVTNCNLLEGKRLVINEYLWSLLPVPFYREIYCQVSGVVLLFTQKFFADVDFRETSSDGYLMEKQDALYQWSKETISAWM